jgi:ELWxxDGT repeat protein
MKKFVLLSFLISGLQFFGQTILESYPGSTPSVFQTSDYINFNNKMYYFGRTSGYQWSLYSTDGTPTGNQVVKDLGLQIGNIISSTYLDQKYNDYKIEYNGKLYFSIYTNSGETLWQSDGTTAGTVQFLNYNYSRARYFKIFNGKLYFTAENGANGREVWSTDGTVAGTAMLKDIYPGANPSIDLSRDPHFTVFNNKLFFVANDGTTGYELWSTDGTTAGTNLFKDIRTTADETESNVYSQGAFTIVSSYSELPFKVVNNKMYFLATDYRIADGQYSSSGGFKLYSTDGTANGTSYVKVPVPANSVALINSVSAQSMTVINNELIVWGSAGVVTINGVGNYTLSPKIMRIDGQNTITDIPATNVSFYNGDSGNSADTEQGSMRLFNGEYYFIGLGLPSGSKLELLKMNPISYAFTKVSQPAALSYIYFNDNNGYSRLLVANEWNGKLYFVKATSSNGAIFATDGTLAGTSQVSRSAIQQSTSSLMATLYKSPISFGILGSGLYFGGSSTFGAQPSLQRFYDPSLLSTKENTLNKFLIYPNPTTSQINLSFGNNLENANLKIVSILGQTVLRKQNLSGNNFSIDVSNLAKGMYIRHLS